MGFREDDRGVSAVVGVVVLLGFFVVGLSLYQGVVVPSHNEEVEYKHSVRVQNDLLEVRNAILRTEATGDDGYVTVELGTRYPARAFAINPPPVSGTVETTESRPVEVRNGTGAVVSDTVCPGEPSSRLLTYDATYHEYDDDPTIRYENSVVYKQFGAGNVTMSGQTLVEDDTITVVPLKRAFSKSGSEAATVTPRAGLLKSTEVANPTVVLPTGLGESDWERLLSGEVDPANVSVSGGNLTLSPAGTFQVTCGPVAVGEAPPSGARGTGAAEINPAGPNDIELRDARIQNGSAQGEVIEVDLNNTANEVTEIEQARISFLYNEQESSTPPTEAVLRNSSTGANSATLVIKGKTKRLSPRIRLPGNATTTTVEFDFDAELTDSDFFVVSLTFENGATGTYFVTPQRT